MSTLATAPHDHQPVSPPTPAAPSRNEIVAPTDGGIALLFVFLIPILLVTGGVSWAASNGNWWTLIPVLLLDLVCTAIVVAATARILRRD